MKFFDSCLTAIIQLFDIITFSSSNNAGSLISPEWAISSAGGGGDSPIFLPPNGPERGSKFKCEYPEMKGWTECSSPGNRSCWLRGPSGEEFNIFTNYEIEAPIGRVRKYKLDVASMSLSPDGFINTEGKVFNQSYPGPWIQACWGDTIEVEVTNYLKYNGTTIHWHGIRQNRTMEMDGVNGVTQCPIAPEDSFTYRFKATQYGTSWYHSHYSLQYGDGLLGPMTIYGPSSSQYDEALDPFLMTDWNHRSAFQDFYQELGVNGSAPPKMTSILLNGRGTDLRSFWFLQEDNTDINFRQIYMHNERK
jgi:Multicopper oxidase